MKPASKPIEKKSSLQKAMELDIVKNNLNFTYEQIIQIYETFKIFENHETEKVRLSVMLEALKLNNFDKENKMMFSIFTQLSEKYPTEIDFQTFLTQICLKIGHPSSFIGREAIFDLLDIDNKGYLEWNELKQIFEKLELKIDEEKLTDLFDSLKGKDGKILKENFESIFIKKFDAVNKIRSRTKTSRNNISVKSINNL